MADDPRGAGPAGGLLFAAVLLVVAYLVISAVAGILKVLIGLAVAVVVIALVVRVIRRR